jgi:GT2 family glycosyltransferase
MSPPLVYVLVINWNGREHLDVCFRSLLESTYENARFVLVDNASEDGSVDFVRETFHSDSRIEILECGENLGWSRGNNRGIAYALERAADYVLLLNNDTRTEPDALAALATFAESDSTIGALSPKLLLFDCPEILNSLGLMATRAGSAWDLGIGRADAPRWNARRDIAGVCGAAMFIRASVFPKAGVLPEDFDIYLDDLDLCLRIWDTGYRILSCPEARIHHKFSATMGVGPAARRKYFLNIRNRARVIMRNVSAPQLPESLGRLFLSDLRGIAHAVLNREFWKAGAHLKSCWEALCYIPAAHRHRLEWRSKGNERGRFWPMLQSGPAFFPGTEFPHNGWYAPRLIGGRAYRPMAPRASFSHTGGLLHIRMAHPYPNLGPQTVRVRRDGEVLTQLHSRDEHEWRFEWPPGELTFESNVLFSVEQTGESIDIAAWLDIERK